MKIVHPLQYDYTAQKYEIGDDELVTVPDQSLSVRQILEGFRRGTIDPSTYHELNDYDDGDVDASADEFIDPIDDLSDISMVAEAAKNIRFSDTHTSDRQSQTQDDNDKSKQGVDESDHVSVDSNDK